MSSGRAIALDKTPLVQHADSSTSCNLALLASDLAAWSGGNDLLRICAAGMWQKQRDFPIKFSLLLTEDSWMKAFRKRLSPWKRATVNLLHLRRPGLFGAGTSRLRRAQIIDAVSSFGGELNAIGFRERENSSENLNRLLTSHSFDVVLPICFHRGELSVPWVGYIPDLQHKHHPEFFSSKERALRDREFPALLNKAKAIIVNSVDTKNDINEAYPHHACAIFNLPFAPALNPKWLNGNIQEAIARYALPERYFLISNQFWVHKSHQTAIDALALLESRYAEVAIVCTGNTSDYRRPDYFRKLQSRIAELRLEHRIRILGLIPKYDQIQIMRGAVAVIQPTLFEGGPGGGAVYDAVSIGTPVILSDIPVNREVEAGRGLIQFFRPGCEEELADKMRIALDLTGKRPSREELLSRSAGRLEALGNQLLRACEFVRSAPPA